MRTAPRPPSAVTRSTVFGTVAALAAIGALSVMAYRSAVQDAVDQHSTQQLAMVRTAAVGVQEQIQGLDGWLRQFGSLPSVQNVELPYLGRRVADALGATPSTVIRYIVRIDASGKTYSWTPRGELQDNGAQAQPEPAMWEALADPAAPRRERMTAPWWMRDPPEHLRALTIPIYRTAPSTNEPSPKNDFNGALALVLDLNRLVEIFLEPAVTAMADPRHAFSLTTPSFALTLRPGHTVAPIPVDLHQHAAQQGTAIVDEPDGRRMHAWAKLDAGGETWLVSSAAPYDAVTGRVGGPALLQVTLTLLLLVTIPVAGWFVIRRQQAAQGAQRDLERRLADAQKMEAIGKLAGGIAHDFNNMLTAILGYASMIQEDAPPRSAIRDQAFQIRRAAENAAALTHKLLAFSRRQVLQPGLVDFRSMLGNLLPLVRRAAGEDVAVTTHIGEELWPIMADPAQIEQSIINLAINAREAMPNGGTLQISAKNAPFPDGQPRDDFDVRPGEYVQVTVTDSGVGMDEATRTRMFEPFFTTKAPGHGTGLGLSTVYGYIRQCGGYINVVSAPGQGTAIELLLPRASATTPPTGMTPSPPLGRVPRGRETVLVAEDEEGVRQLAVEALVRSGYEVLSAEHGDAALRVAASHDGPIHLLVTDVVMPGMKGPELAERLRSLRPGLRVLLISNYAADVVTPNDLRQARLLSKPFSPSALSAAVRAQLDEPLSSEPASQG